MLSCRQMEALISACLEALSPESSGPFPAASHHDHAPPTLLTILTFRTIRGLHAREAHPQRRPGRLLLHGAHALERLPAGEPLLRRLPVRRAAQGADRPFAGPARGGRAHLGLGG